MSQQYGNLKSREDWHKLFGDLVHMHAFANRIWLQKVNPVTFRQLVRMTSLLFQAITPIRFAFVDGQSRMTGACHLLRNTMPEKSLIAPQRRILKRAPGETDFHLPDNSMIAPFGTMSSTNLVLVCGKDTTQQFLSPHNAKALWNNSNKIQESVRSATDLSLSDVVIRILDKMKESPTIYLHADNNGKEIIDCREYLNEKRVWLIDQFLQESSDVVMELLHCMVGNKKTTMDDRDSILTAIVKPKGVIKLLGIPTITTKIRNPGELTAIALLLAQTVNDVVSLDLLRELIERNWEPRTEPEYFLGGDTRITFYENTIRSRGDNINPKIAKVSKEIFGLNEFTTTNTYKISFHIVPNTT